MAIQQRETARDREAFLGGLAPRSMRPEIAVSWRRCHRLDLPVDATAPRYAPVFDSDSPLIRAARPVLDRVTERLGDLGVSFLLTDASARIVDRRCSDRGLLDRLDGVFAAEGYVFAEDEVGTNGAGTALEVGRPVRVDGHEHYAGSLHQFTCVGVPIRGVDGRVRGLLDVTCPADGHNALVEYLAEQTAEEIESRLSAQRSTAERALFDRYFAASRCDRTEFLLVSEQVLISSPRAAQLLDGAGQAFVWEHVARMLRSGSGTVHIDLPTGRRVVLSGAELRDGGDRIGAIVEIREDRADAGGAVHVAPTAPGSPAGLVGADPAWLRACHHVLDAVRDHVVLICGETGVGKAALAEATHTSGPLMVHDAASTTSDAPADRLESWRGRSGQRPGTLVVRHVDALAPRVLRGVVAELEAARAGGWRCLATSDLPVPTAVRGVRARIVTVPPLRNRIDDVPALARSFATPRRLAPDLVGLLLRMPWQGNVAALRGAVDRARLAARGPEIQVRDLPADVRSTAFRRRMSRFEQAEMAAILDALSEVGGNKKAAAGLLGISRSTLYRKLEAAGLDPVGGGAR